MKKRLVKNPFFRAFIFLFALELVAISINFFYAPINIAAGGATGMAVLLEAAFGFNRSLCVLVINTLMLILAWIFIDWKTVKKFIIGSYLLPVLIYVTPSFEIVSDKLLAVILGGVFSAIGVAALYRINAASGGTTVPPLIIERYFHVNPAVSLLVIDMIVTLFNIPVSGIDAFFMAAFSLFVSLFVMRYMESGLDHKYQIQVMSNDKLPEIRKMLEDADNSLTIFDVRGGYSLNDKKLIMAVVDNDSYGKLLSRIHDIALPQTSSRSTVERLASRLEKVDDFFKYSAAQPVHSNLRTKCPFLLVCP